MRSTAKLAFEMLEKEMEVISSDETIEITGGSGFFPSTGVFFDGDSSGVYLRDSSTYYSQSGNPYNKVSFDHGVTWINVSCDDNLGVSTGANPHFGYEWYNCPVENPTSTGMTESINDAMKSVMDDRSVSDADFGTTMFKIMSHNGWF